MRSKGNYSLLSNTQAIAKISSADARSVAAIGIRGAVIVLTDATPAGACTWVPTVVWCSTFAFSPPNSRGNNPHSSSETSMRDVWWIGSETKRVQIGVKIQYGQ